MHMPTANALLQAWEDGIGQSATRRAVHLLGAAWPQCTPAALAALPVGRRDARLFRLRHALFGESMAALVQCPACGEQLDVTFGIDQVCPHREQDQDQDQDADAGPAQYRLQQGGYDIRYRLPNSADLLSLPADGGEAPAAALLRRCVDAVQHGGVAIAPDALPAALAAALSEAMAQADPHARIELALNCPACGHGWQSLLDIGSFLWREVDAWARRTLHDVHALACAYGWSEAEILALPARRRELYLSMVRP